MGYTPILHIHVDISETYSLGFSPAECHLSEVFLPDTWIQKSLAVADTGFEKEGDALY